MKRKKARRPGYRNFPSKRSHRGKTRKGKANSQKKASLLSLSLLFFNFAFFFSLPRSTLFPFFSSASHSLLSSLSLSHICGLFFVPHFSPPLRAKQSDNRKGGRREYNRGTRGGEESSGRRSSISLFGREEKGRFFFLFVLLLLLFEEFRAGKNERRFLKKGFFS